MYQLHRFCEAAMPNELMGAHAGGFQLRANTQYLFVLAQRRQAGQIHLPNIEVFGCLNHIFRNSLSCSQYETRAVIACNNDACVRLYRTPFSRKGYMLSISV
jgi:hypothetical protein